MTANRTCPECQTPLTDDSPAGLCPHCLLQRGLGSDTSSTTTGFGPFSPPSVDELRPLFPKLEIIELLGQGGMGAVYKARQPGLDRLVALKILPPAADASFAERFTREARTLAKLNHPGIVTVFDFGQAGGFYYFVMEFVEGVNLRQAQQAHKLTPAEALAIVPKICEALQVAHDAGVVHRDIKPENILIAAKGRVKIADFGLAKLLHSGPEQSHLTGTSQAMGTMHYMAPEQWEKPLTVDHRADIYSLGVVFYELLTGELPLGRFASPSQKVQVDVRIDDVVLRTLEKEPDRHYQHASDVKTDVERIAAPPDRLATMSPTQPVMIKRLRFSLNVALPMLGLVFVCWLVAAFVYSFTEAYQELGDKVAAQRALATFWISCGVAVIALVFLTLRWRLRRAAARPLDADSAAAPAVRPPNDAPGPPMTHAPGFLRSVLWPVLGLAAIAVVSAGVAMTESFGSFRGPAQIVNGFSTLLVPVVFVVLMIRWMWLTLRPQRPVIFWLFAVGLTLILALGYSVAVAVIFMRGGAAPTSERNDIDSRQQLLIGQWIWTDGRVGTTEFRSDGTFEERSREKYRRMINTVTGPEEHSGVDELSLNGQYEWLRADRIRTRTTSRGVQEFSVLFNGDELTLKEGNGGVHRMKRKPAEPAEALIGVWESTSRIVDLVGVTYRGDGTVELRWANGVVNNGEYTWLDAHHIEEKYRSGGFRYKVVIESDTLTLLDEKGGVHRMKRGK